MKKIAIAAVFLALLAMPALGQTNTPPISFSVATQATMWRGAGDTEAGTEIEGTLDLTPHWAGKSYNLEIPTPGISVNTLGGEGCGNTKGSEWQFCADGGFGVTSSTSTGAHSAFNLGGRVNHLMSDTGKFSWNVVNFQYWRAPIQDGSVATKNSYTVTTGLNIDLSSFFGKK